MIKLGNEKVEFSEEELNKIKILCDFLFFDQYKSSASYPRFQQAFAALIGNSKIDLFQTFKKICGERKKYITFGRMIKAFLKSKKEKNSKDDIENFFNIIMDDKTIKKEEEEAGIEYENAIRYSTKQGNMRHFVSKVCVITDETSEKIKGLRIYYDDFFKNDLFFNKRGEKYIISMELNLIGDLTDEEINGRADMNTMDGITNIFGTFTDKITFIGFKCRSGKNSFYGKPEGTPFFYGSIGRHVKTFKCEVKNGVLTSILPGFVDVIRRNSYIDKSINDIQNDIDHCDDYIYEEETLININDPEELDKNIRNPMIPDDYFFDKKFEDKIKGTDINEIIPENEVKKDVGKYSVASKEIEIDPDKLLEEAAMFSKYKELRETLQNQKDLLLDTGRFDEMPKDPDGEYKKGDSIEGKDLNIFIKNPQNYDNLTKEVGQNVEEAIRNENPVDESEKEFKYPNVEIIKTKDTRLNNRNDMQNYFDNINSGYYDRVIGGFDDEKIDMTIYEKKETKEEIMESEKKAQGNWKKVSEKISTNQGIFILQTIGSVIKATKLLKDDLMKKGKRMTTKERLNLYKLLKINKPIIDMLSKAHMEELRRKEEEENVKNQIEELKNNKDLTDEEKRNKRQYIKHKQSNAIEAASEIFREKAKEIHVKDFPLISNKLEKLNEMKKNVKDKKKEEIINEYMNELTQDKIAIINAIKEKNRDKIKSENTETYNNIIQNNQKLRSKMIKNESKDIKEFQKQEDQELEKQMPKTKLISFNNIQLPEGKKIFRNQKVNTSVFSDTLFKPIRKSLCSLTENGTWNLPSRANKDDVRGWEKYNWTSVNHILDSPNYQVYYDDINSNEIIQGDFQNCNFITAVAALCKYPELIKKLFLFKEKSIEHAYGVYLRVNGIWKLIILDDFLPYYFDTEGQYRFVFSSSFKKEIWICLLEKAWAKLNGNYIRSIESSPSEIFDVLTDAYTDILYISPPEKDEIYKALYDGQSKGYILTAETSNESKIEEYGLVPFRAYIILEVIEINSNNKKVKLIHLRNLWGNGDEWNGDWCNSSSLWTPELRKICKVQELTKENKLLTGTFWMSIDDFSKYFYITYITHVNQNYVNSYKKISKNDCLNGPMVHKLIVNENDTDAYIQLHQKNPRIILKDLTRVNKSVYGYIMLTDVEGNYIDTSGKGTFNNCLHKKLNKGEYYLITDLNFRFFNINHGYSISIYSSSHIEINEGDVEIKSLLDASLISFSQGLKFTDVSGAKLISTDIGNCPLKAAILDNTNGNENLLLKASLKRYGKNSADFYCENGREKENEIIKFVIKGDCAVTIAYPYTNSSLYDLKMSASKE